MADSRSSSPSKGWHIALWVVQVLLAFAFLAAGLIKLTSPYEELGKQMAWVTHMPPAIVKLIGAIEFSGALGLILPAATRILPILTPIAGLGLVLDMTGAAFTHLSIGEPQLVVANAVLGGLAALIAWGRFRKAPIEAR